MNFKKIEIKPKPDKSIKPPKNINASFHNNNPKPATPPDKKPTK